MKQKKILILANSDMGLYKFRKELIQNLQEIEYEVDIAVPQGEHVKYFEQSGCRVHEIPLERRGTNIINDFRLFLNYYHLIYTVRPSLVITYTIKPNIYGGAACSLLHIPYVMNVTGLGSAFETKDVVHALVMWMYRYVCLFSKKVFFENTTNANTFLRHHLIDRRRIVLMHGAGVNLEEFCYSEYPQEEVPVRFLFIGRVMKEKGIDEYLEAARQIREEHTDIYFDVVGPYEDDYAKRLALLQKQGIIQYYGYQEDVKPYIQRASCFVLPSYHEGMANTLQEAAAMGRPLITCNIPGCREAVIEGKTGFLCIPRNTESLTDQMIRFLHLSYEKRRRMGIMGYKYMVQRFDRNDVCAKSLEIIEKLINCECV